MRRLIVTEFLSLDGVMEAPGWTFKYWNDEIAAFKAEETSADQHLLLGRVTYEGFAEAWPKRTDVDSGGVYFNSTRKYVVTATLDTLEWNNSVLLKGDVLEEVRNLKAQDGPDLVVHGSATLAQTLIENGLVDTLRLLVYPVLVGQGIRLFKAGMTNRFSLVETRSFSTGVVALIYAPDRS